MIVIYIACDSAIPTWDILQRNVSTHISPQTRIFIAPFAGNSQNLETIQMPNSNKIDHLCWYVNTMEANEPHLLTTK